MIQPINLDLALIHKGSFFHLFSEVKLKFKSEQIH